jgi:hypothetical protein
MLGIGPGISRASFSKVTLLTHICSYYCEAVLFYVFSVLSITFIFDVLVTCHSFFDTKSDF